MARKGLGKGLDSLIPNIFDEDFDSNSAQSLEDMMKGEEETVKEVIDDIESKNVESSDVEEEQIEEEKENAEEAEPVEEDEAEDEQDNVDSNDTEEIQKEIPVEQEEEETPDGDESSEDIPGDSDSEEDVQAPQKIQVKEEHVEEVKEIVDKNPRITLWSARSSAVFRYLRKTEPEFSISKEASVLIEEAVSKKYPEIWALFEDL